MDAYNCRWPDNVRFDLLVTRISFEGAGDARLSPLVSNAFDHEDLAAIIVCPSNPYLSVDPILAIPEFRQKLGKRKVPAVAISPLIGGKAVKGPTAKLMQELGIASTSKAIADHYHGLIDGLIVDSADAKDQESTGLPVLVTQTLIVDIDNRIALGGRALMFAERLSR
jgi:LPPG:FO 2-phospho-L-lactate transferase